MDYAPAYDPSYTREGQDPSAEPPVPFLPVYAAWQTEEGEGKRSTAPGGPVYEPCGIYPPSATFPSPGKSIPAMRGVMPSPSPQPQPVPAPQSTEGGDGDDGGSGGVKRAKKRPQRPRKLRRKLSF